MTDGWLEHLATELGIEVSVPNESLLDAGRVVAHTVERKATPLTTYLIGVASGGDRARAEEICQRVIRLAREWEARG